VDKKDTPNPVTAGSTLSRVLKRQQLGYYNLQRTVLTVKTVENGRHSSYHLREGFPQLLQYCSGEYFGV